MMNCGVLVRLILFVVVVSSMVGLWLVDSSVIMCECCYVV